MSQISQVNTMTICVLTLSKKTPSITTKNVEFLAECRDLDNYAEYRNYSQQWCLNLAGNAECHHAKYRYANCLDLDAFKC